MILFVFVGAVNHVFIYVEYSASIYEVSVEPAVEGKLFIIIELYPHIIVDENLCTAYEEVVVGVSTDELHRWLLLLPEVVEDMTFADDFEVRENASFRQVWNCNHADLVDFLHHSVKLHGNVLLLD